MSDVVIVGPCGAGKTTLARTLKARGFGARAVAQEHSGVRDLWRHGGEPAATVFLDATPEVITVRRNHDFPVWLHAEQQHRLADARTHAQLIIDTTPLGAAEVCERVIQALHELGVYPNVGQGEPPGNGLSPSKAIQ